MAQPTGNRLDLEAEEVQTHQRAGVTQIMSLTHSILLTFHNQGLVGKSAFSTNKQSKLASVVVDGVLGPPRLARHT